MNFKKYIDWNVIIKVIFSGVLFALLLFLMGIVFFFGYQSGWRDASLKYEAYVNRIIDKVSSTEIFFGGTPEPVAQDKPNPPKKEELKVNWSGPQLWDAVNSKRVSYGVNPLSQKDELCTIAAIRLNELLVEGKLDNHEGFSNMPERRNDLKWIFDKYVIAEFLVSGAESASEAVSLWDNTLGHKKLLTGGEYVYGCTYAQDGIGVAIAAYE